MKTNIYNLFRLCALTTGLGLMTTNRVTAQTFTVVHSFTTLTNSTNCDGAYPNAVIISGNTLYGTTANGGSTGNGTVFSVNIDGTGFVPLHSFTGVSGDGANPFAGLILSGNTLYGTASAGGEGIGTIFKLNTNGMDFTNFYTFDAFDDPNGGNPGAELVLSGDTLYGTTAQIGGQVFKVTTNGMGFTPIYSDAYLNAIILSGSILYGTANGGGNSGPDTLFKVNTDSTGYALLNSFPNGSTNGYDLVAGVTLGGSTLYGTAFGGGSSDNGTVFAVSTSGTGFTNLYNFTAGSGSFPNVTNTDGADPFGGLILSGNTLFGTAYFGGSAGNGTVFAVSTNGTCFTTLHSFGPGANDPSNNYTNSDGAYPAAALILSGHTLYGTANVGGSSGNGTVFSLSITPTLAIVPSGTNVVLTWPTNIGGIDFSGFNLQATTNLAPAAWGTNVPGPVIVNGQKTVTNPIFGTHKFYRLIQ